MSSGIRKGKNALLALWGGLVLVLVILALNAADEGPAGANAGTTGRVSTSGEAGATNSRWENPRWWVHTTVNVRAGPGTENEVLYQLETGESVFTSIRADGGWKAVHRSRNRRDTVGWIASRLLRPGPPKDLQVVSYQSEQGQYGNQFVTGRVRNNSGHAYRYAQVEITLLDEAGNVVGSTIDNVTNLRAGKTWRFRAIVTEPSAAQFRIADVSGY